MAEDERGTSPTLTESSEVSSPQSSAASPTSGGGKGKAVETENVGVMIRIRPFNKTEISLGDPNKDPPVNSLLYVKDDTVVSVLDPANIESGQVKESFAYDRVFWSVPPEAKQPSLNTEFATQETVFQHVGLPVVEAVLGGRNSCVFAYGQTGSGKTHTMLGAPGDKGLIPRVINHLFDNGGNRIPSYIERSIQASFLEIYNEKVKDLLEAHALAKASPKKGHAETGFADRKVRYNPEMGTYVDGLRRVPVSTPEECDEVIQAGTSTRTVAATQMNDTSSRSHAILQLHVRQKDNHLGVQRSAILNLVDLAGSERVKMSGVSGQQLSEAKNINLSLTTLRRVIDTLLENAKNPKKKAVAPYRESMLTWVLSDSLGGNCRTTMLGTVSPHARNYEDTINTLRYALKAKAIACTVKVNEEKCAVVVNALKNEMQLLKKQLASEAKPEDNTAANALSERDREMKEREAKAAAEARASAEAKEQLRRQVTKSQVALKKAQSMLFKKRELAEQNKAIEEELAKVAEFREKAARMVEEDKELEIEYQRQLQEAREIELEIEGIQEKQLQREAEALAAKQKEQRDMASLLFRTATRFGKDRMAMAELHEKIEAQNKKEKQHHEHSERVHRKIDQAYEDLSALRDCVSTGEHRVRDQEEVSKECVDLRSDRIKMMYDNLYSVRLKTKHLKTEETQKVEAEIKDHYEKLLPVHLERIEKASKEARVVEKELQAKDTALTRDLAHLTRQVKNYDIPCQTSQHLIEDSQETISELEIAAVEQEQNISVLLQEIHTLEEENKKLDAENSATQTALWHSAGALDELSGKVGFDAPNHKALKVLLRQDTSASSVGGGGCEVSSNAGGSDDDSFLAQNGRSGSTNEAVLVFRSQSSLGAAGAQGGGNTTPRNTPRSKIHATLRRTGMTFATNAGGGCISSHTPSERGSSVNNTAELESVMTGEHHYQSSNGNGGDRSPSQPPPPEYIGGPTSSREMIERLRGGDSTHSPPSRSGSQNYLDPQNGAGARSRSRSPNNQGSATYVTRGSGQPVAATGVASPSNDPQERLKLQAKARSKSPPVSMKPGPFARRLIKPAALVATHGVVQNDGVE